MAASIAEWCRARGAAVRCEPEDAEAPVVLARFDVGAARTVLLYNMYDVMPADETGWTVPPFEGALVERADVGWSLVGRGAENNKGPLAGMLVVLDAMLGASGTLPANVEVLVEGEEESGSGALRAMLAAEPRLLRPAHAALFPSFCEYAGAAPRVFLGFKGIAHGAIRCVAGGWGGPGTPAHSSYAPWIASPAWRLVEALAALARPPTGDVDLDGQSELEERSGELVAALSRRFSPDRELRARHAARLAVDEPGPVALARLLTSSSLNLSRLVAGDPTTAVIPPRAEATFDLRLRPGVAPEAVLAELERRLAAAGAEGVEIDVRDAYPGWAFGREAPGVGALIATYRDLGIDPEVWPWAPGAAPASAFRPLAPSFLIGGLGRGGNAHGVDEFVTLEGMRRFVVSLCVWLHYTGRDVTLLAEGEHG
jgi:acetylornithine deacetylase/succinyl-diaminopimelate desuccinylase-like protein